ncbi:hypothetical protein CDAR_479991 [Caerostris darwini]|uniref:NADH:ubiquinone reductase (H(+)-translocating) n=1 Tax=Caerostris darwini TaxID=1538125 RepID=A0AAV4T2I1_9ARAC|nr:hypothetical protein CDAR_479991 [Caerostris darwini]
MKREEPTLKRTVWVRERRVVIGCPLLCFLCSGPSVLRPNSILFHSPSLELFMQKRRWRGISVFFSRKRDIAAVESSFIEHTLFDRLVILIFSRPLAGVYGTFFSSPHEAATGAMTAFTSVTSDPKYRLGLNSLLTQTTAVGHVWLP